MRTSAATIAVAVAVALMNGLARAECDCKTYPFKPDPPCFEDCCVKFLNRAYTSDLQRVLGVDAQIAAKIYSVSAKNRGVRSFNDYRKVLSADEFGAIERRMRNLDDSNLKQVYAVSKDPAQTDRLKYFGGR